MLHFTNLKASLGKSLCDLGLVFSVAPPEEPPCRVSFDSLRIADPGQSPDHLPALFNSHERSLGDPARLFPGKVCNNSELADQKRVKVQWLDVLDGLKPYGLRGQISGINTYLNHADDIPTLACLGKKFPRNTQWTTPLNLFHNAGSEHIAFAKYLSLRKIGVSARRLRLVWVEDSHDQTSRVVLAATFGGCNYILDNHRAEIIEDGDLKHFRPYCSTSRSRFSLHWDGNDSKGWETSLKQLGSYAH